MRIAVDAFLHDKISFPKIYGLIEETLSTVGYISTPTYEDYVNTNAEARRKAKALVKAI